MDQPIIRSENGVQLSGHHRTIAGTLADFPLPINISRSLDRRAILLASTLKGLTMPFESYRITCVIEYPYESSKLLTNLGFVPTTKTGFELGGEGFVLEARIAEKLIDIEFAYDNSTLVDNAFLEITQSLWDSIELAYLASAIDKANIEFGRNGFMSFRAKFCAEIQLLRNLWISAFGFKGNKTYVKDAYNRII